MLGMFALNAQGLNGSVLQMVNHGLSTSALFLLVGMIYERRHTRQISDFGGIARPMPVFAFFFGLVTMSSIGLPALNGFVGEFLILLGAFLSDPTTAILATSACECPALRRTCISCLLSNGSISSCCRLLIVDATSATS